MKLLLENEKYFVLYFLIKNTTFLESVGLVKKITNLFKDEALCLTDGEDIISNLHNVCFKAETSRSSKAIMDTGEYLTFNMTQVIFKAI